MRYFYAAVFTFQPLTGYHTSKNPIFNVYAWPSKSARDKAVASHAASHRGDGHRMVAITRREAERIDRYSGNGTVIFRYHTTIDAFERIETSFYMLTTERRAAIKEQAAARVIENAKRAS